MLLALLILVALLTAATVAATVAVLAPHLGSSLRRQRVIVNLRSGPALTGTLQRSWGGRLELSDARVHDAGEVRQVDGRAIAWRSNVAFVQVLPPIDPDTGSSS